MDYLDFVVENLLSQLRHQLVHEDEIVLGGKGHEEGLVLLEKMVQVRARVWDGLTIGIDRRKVVQVPCLLDLYWPCRAQQEAMPRNSSWVAAVHRVDAKGNDRLGRLWVSDSKQVIRLVIWEQRQQEAARNVSKQHLERERPELSVRVRAREKGTDRARVDRHLLTRGARASQLGLCLTSLRLRSRRREGLKGIRLTPDEVAGRCRRE